MEVEVIFEDDQLVVINKPAGVVVNKAESVKSETIQRWFVEKYHIGQGSGEFFAKGGVVHRLDKDTSGVMVLAKTQEAYEALKRQFLKRRVKKRYVALVHGKFSEKEGIISAPLMRHPKYSYRYTIGGEATRTAITNWYVVNQFSVLSDQFSLLELEPHTGRTHQLRVHLQSIHHPIVSDPIYGFSKTWRQDLEWCGRLFLHARSLEFAHPGDGRFLKFESVLPVELQLALQKFATLRT